MTITAAIAGRMFWMMLVAAPVAPLPSAAMAQNALAPGLTPIHRSEMVVAAQAQPFSVVHGVLDFAPGSRFPFHVHGGPALYTMIDGNVLVEEGDYERQYGAGESYTQSTGEVLAATNPGENASSMAVAFILPGGAELTTLTGSAPQADAPPAPAMIHNAATEPLTMSEPFTIVQMIFGLEPGTRTPRYSHPGPALVTVMQGEIEVQREGEATLTAAAASGWTVKAGQQVGLTNAGDENARLVATVLRPEGETLTLTDE